MQERDGGDVGALRRAATAVLAGAALCALGVAGAAAAAAVPGSGAATPTTPAPRSADAYTAVTLTDGRVYVQQYTTYQASRPTPGEIYDPGTSSWSDVPPQPGGGSGGVLVALPGDRVLSISAQSTQCCEGAVTAELDVSTLTWKLLSDDPLVAHVDRAVVLNDGAALTFGPMGASVLDPSTGTVTAVSTPAGYRQSDLFGVAHGASSAYVFGGAHVLQLDDAQHALTELDAPGSASGTALALPDGEVMVQTGGADSSTGVPRPTSLFDPESGTWRRGGRPLFAHGTPQLVAAAHGQVLMAGSGYNVTAPPELYDPATDLWSPITSALPLDGGTATALPDGRVVLVGGHDGTPTVTDVITVTPGGPDPTSAPSPPGQLSLYASATTARPLQTVSLGGRLTDRASSAPRVGAPVDLWRRSSDATSSWTLVASTTTDSHGMVAFTDVPDAAVTYVLRHADDGTTGPTGSDPVAVGLAVAPTVPSAARNVYAVPLDGAADVHWDAPADDGGTPIAGYTVTLSGRTQNVAPTARTASFTGLTNGSTYYATVTPVNLLGNGPVAGSNTVVPSAGLTEPDHSVGTEVCGSLPIGTTTWTGVGSPYWVCPLGITVPEGAELDVDGTGGAVSVVVATSSSWDAGTIVVGGTLATTGTVTFDGAAAEPGGWQGIRTTSDCCADPSTSRTAVVDLGGATTIRDATFALNVTRAVQLVLDGTTITDTTEQAAYVSDAPVSMTDIDVERIGPPVQPAYQETGGGVEIDATSGQRVVVVGSTFRDIAGSGLDVGGDGDITVHDDLFERDGVTSAPYGVAVPPVAIAGEGYSIGPDGDVHDINGDSNVVDAIWLGGLVTSSNSFVPFTNGTTPHPLGWVGHGASWGPGATLTIPAGAAVYGSFGAHGGTLDASAGGVRWTGLSDPALGLCATAIYCSYGPGSIGATGPTSHVVLAHDDLLGSVGGYTGASVSITDSTIDVGGGNGGGGVDVAGTLDLERTTIHDGSSDGGSYYRPMLQTGGPSTIRDVTVDGLTYTATNASPQPPVAVDLGGGAHQLDVKGLTVQNVAGTGVTLEASEPIAVRNVVIRNTTWPASYRIASAELAPAGPVELPTGSGNEQDAVGLSGTIDGSFTVTPVVDLPIDHPLGTELVDVDATGPGAVTLPAGIDPVSQLRMDGESLHVQAGADVRSEINPLATPPKPTTTPTLTGISFTAMAVAGPPTLDVTITGANGEVPITIATTGHVTSFAMTGSNWAAPVSVDGVESATFTADTGDHRWSISGTPHIDVDTVALSGAASGLTVVGPHGDLAGAGPADDIVVRHVTVAGSAPPAQGWSWPDQPRPPVLLCGIRAAIGPGGGIDDLQGAGNTIDAVGLEHITALGGLTWTSIVDSPLPHPLGDLETGFGCSPSAIATSTTTSAHLNMAIVGGTLTFPKDAVVKGAGGIVLTAGAQVDATAGGATFPDVTDTGTTPVCGPLGGVIYSTNDQSGGFNTCGGTSEGYVSLYDAPAFAPDFSPGGGMAFVDASLPDVVSVTGVTRSPDHPDEGLYIKDSVLGAVHALDSSVLIDGAGLGTIGISGGPGAELDDIGLRTTPTPVEGGIEGGCECGVITASDVVVHVNGLTAVGVQNPLELDGVLAGSTVDCADIEDSPAEGGIYVKNNTAAVTVRHSALFGSTNLTGWRAFDLRNTDFFSTPAYPVVTDDVFWGQPGGPVAGQISGPDDVTVSDPADATPACAAAAHGPGGDGSGVIAPTPSMRPTPSGTPTPSPSASPSPSISPSATAPSVTPPSLPSTGPSSPVPGVTRAAVPNVHVDIEMPGTVVAGRDLRVSGDVVTDASRSSVGVVVYARDLATHTLTSSPARPDATGRWAVVLHPLHRSLVIAVATVQGTAAASPLDTVTVTPKLSIAVAHVASHLRVRAIAQPVSAGLLLTARLVDSRGHVLAIAHGRTNTSGVAVMTLPRRAGEHIVRTSVAATPNLLAATASTSTPR
ncbi:MAG TPA: fibronectin type III domain-containing protein [Mycobacteriales bacterium]|nr:fibronectin type III domain-containing protein [Mycobacteriales bacterium]